MVNPGMMVSERYEIIDRVGAGGMADVYKAKDHRLNRFVAIKILKQEYSNDAKFVAKFRAEAQSVAGLSHPNIVNVFDVGDDDGLHYIVMELVEGITLKKFIEKKGKLDIKEAVGIAVQIAQGMEAAHKNHIIHRDIKPQNIIISKEGKVKVTDFGIAKAATSNTITSNAMGSVHYISPEQARGGYSDEKSDVYSLGVTMYEMLSGKVPFEGDSTVTVALAHIQETARTLKEIDPDVPLSLSKIIEKCMQKKPDMRYPTAASLIIDLKRALVEPDGEFVVMEDMIEDTSPTIMFSTEDLEAIKEAPRTIKEPEASELLDEDEIDPKLERILKICSAVVAVIIVIVVLLIVGKVSGWWGGSKGKDTKPSPTPVVTDTPSPSEDADNQEVTVPPVVGKTIAEAQQLIEENGLKWKMVEDDTDGDYDKVNRQEPAAGSKVEPETEVTLYYRAKGDNVVIPSLENYTEADARAELEGMKLEVMQGTSEDYHDTVEKGKVCGTIPAAGTSVSKNSKITLIISKGKENKQVTVPSLWNKKESVAKEKLADRGLKYPEVPDYQYSDTVAKGKVIYQSVASGQKVDVGTRIDFTVSMGPKPTVAPKATPTPKPEENYTYEASFTIKDSDNPFEYADEDSALIKLVLTQDGKKKTVWSGNLSYNDFPKTFLITGWSENNGTIDVYKDDVKVGGSYNIEFKKVKQ